jgi:hypothetical protein
MAWINDYPDSDLNLSFRLQQLTSMKVDPNGRTLKLTNADLFNYPFIYMVKAGRMELRDEEVPILRKYLASGGALMADDFWGDDDWSNFETQIKRVLPRRQWVELPMSHRFSSSPFRSISRETKTACKCPRFIVGRAAASVTAGRRHARHARARLAR